MTMLQYKNEVTNQLVDLTQEDVVEIKEWLEHAYGMINAIENIDSWVDITTPNIQEAMDLAIDKGLDAYESCELMQEYHNKWMSDEIEEMPQDLMCISDVLYNVKDGCDSKVVYRANIHNDVAYGGVDKINAIANELGFELFE